MAINSLNINPCRRLGIMFETAPGGMVGTDLNWEAGETAGAEACTAGETDGTAGT